MSGQTSQATSIKEAMNKHFGSLQVEMDKNKELQKQMLELQQQSLEKQKQALDHLAIIQNRVQTVVNQTYELHEYPIPRLFIVLPKAMRRHKRLGKIFSKQFRLFFLCECGAHTMREGSKVQHKIHLAKHEGYDLEKPTEFFAKYGPYVLAMMQMVKYGFTVAEFIVPALAHTGLVEGIDAVQQGLDFAKSNIGSLVEDTINFIQGQQDSANGGMSLEGGDQTDVDNLQVLEGADLRQLQGYLSVSDKGRVLGNLYRIVTLEGHVKWVCIDHYRENYRESSTLQLRDLVSANSGTFIEEKGRIEVKLATGIRAMQFYDVMTKARGIQELAITLQWDVTLDDLRTLAAAVNKANVVYLIVDGSSFKGGPALDLINRGRRFDPILELMSNARIQCIKLHNFEEFCLRVGSSSIVMAPQLRLLSIGLSVSLYEKTAQLVTEKMDHFKALETLAIICNGRSITVRFSRGKVHAMAMSVHALVDLSEDELKYCAMGRLRKLEVSNTPAEADEGRLAAILQQNLGLEEIVVGCDVERLPAIIRLITSTREQLVSQGRTVALRQLEVVKSRGISQADLGKNENVKTVVIFDGFSSALSISSVIDLSGSNDSNCLTRVSELFRDYAWTAERLITNSTFDDRLAGVLDEVTAEKGSRLKYLELFPKLMTYTGVDSIDRVIARSQDLEGLRIQFHGLRDEWQQEKAERMLRQHGQRLTALLLNGFAAEVWIPRLAKTCPTRRDLPEIQDFRIFCLGKQKISQGSAQWIADMVASPPNDVAMQLSSQTASQNVHVVQTSQPPTQTELSEAWKPLKEIYLVCLVIQPDDWKTIIKAMDFTALEQLQVSNTNFSFEEFKFMVDCISDKARVNVPLMKLNVEKTALSKGDDTAALRELIARLKKKAPLANIVGV
ncbi:hypothetical protein BGZ58_008532 [Dissophora ornata]|nr:hypothetical protein BGZ58_008532 [Dissophora ornata]